VPALFSYAVLAVDEEGAVHFFNDQEALEGMAKMFIDGEFTLVVDARGSVGAHRLSGKSSSSHP
jgi:hypothetical protein